MVQLTIFVQWLQNCAIAYALAMLYGLRGYIWNAQERDCIVYCNCIENAYNEIRME